MVDCSNLIIYIRIIRKRGEVIYTQTEMLKGRSVMGNMSTRSWAILVVVVILILGWGISYNSLARGEQKIGEAKGNLASDYQRQYDLIPNVVEATKGYFSQEQAIYDKIKESREQYSNAKENGNEQATLQAGDAMNSAIGRLLMITESNPEIKSSENVKDLVVELEGSQNRINKSRKDMNEAINSYNNKVVSLPTSVVASIHGFQKDTYFEADSGAIKPPTVNLNLDTSTTTTTR